MFERLRAHLDQLHWKALAKRAVRRMGYAVTRIDPRPRSHNDWAEDRFHDQKLVADIASAGRPGVVFDVGANVGETVAIYRALFPSARIHAFEPLPKAYRQLVVAAHAAGNTQVNQLALHDAKGVRKFLSNRGGANQTSSFLPPAQDVHHAFPAHVFQLDKVIDVKVSTLDDYCSEHSVEHIDVLKLDTQGTELDILRGAQKLIDRRAITLMYIEISFAPLYANSPLYHRVASFLEDNGYDLFRIYAQSHGTAGRHVGGDAIFAERAVLKKYLDQRYAAGTSEPLQASA
jgi:FkbM family methyltransferase